MVQTAIVIPCFNEADRLDADALMSFDDAHPTIQLRLVNDGSSDATWDLLRDVQRASHGRIVAEDLVHNQGKAEAVRKGVLNAIDDGCEYVGYWDADLATPLDAIVQFRDLLQQRQDVDLVMGARMPLCGRRIERQKWRAKCGRLFATSASWVLGFSIYDTQCGAKLMRTSAGVDRWFDRPFNSRWIFDVELLARMQVEQESRGRQREPLPIYEMPLEYWRDVAGSKLKPTDFYRAFFELVRIYWNYRCGFGRFETAAAQSTIGAQVDAGHPSSGRTDETESTRNRRWRRAA